MTKFGVKQLAHSHSFAIPWTVACQLLCSWDLPGRNTGVRCHFLLQGIFLTWVSCTGRQFLYRAGRSPLWEIVEDRRACRRQPMGLQGVTHDLAAEQPPQSQSCSTEAWDFKMPLSGHTTNTPLGGLCLHQCDQVHRQKSGLQKYFSRLFIADGLNQCNAVKTTNSGGDQLRAWPNHHHCADFLASPV